MAVAKSNIATANAPTVWLLLVVAVAGDLAVRADLSGSVVVVCLVRGMPRSLRHVREDVVADRLASRASVDDCRAEMDSEIDPGVVDLE